MKIRLSTSSRISLGLVLLTISILLAADTVGLIPSRSEMILDGRKKLCESLAVQCAVSAERDDLAAIQAVIGLVVDRDGDILSAAVRTPDGAMLVEVGDHHSAWGVQADDASPTTHVQVPVFRDGVPWWTLEIRFREIGSGWVLGSLTAPFVRLVVFVALTAFVAYMFFLKRTLRHLDPTSVVPKRVRSALDTFAEGVVILDRHEHIVLANSAFAEMVGRSAESLVGRGASELGWSTTESCQQGQGLPWTQTLQDGGTQTAVAVGLSTAEENRRNFMVNAAPILDANGGRRGAIVTFNDVTQLEERNTLLQQMLSQLKASRNEIGCQNRELQFLATRDPLTGCLNRRSLFEKVDADISAARRYGYELSCIMLDVDHFKAVNDRYGHAVGDELLKMVAETLCSTLRPSDVVCRYGGEEFCMLLPHTDIHGAVETAERIRHALAARDIRGIRVTVSSGISSTAFEAKGAQELIDQADQALYRAKNSGRNTVACWDQVSADAARPGATADAAADTERPIGERIPIRAVRAMAFALAHRDVETAEHSRQVADLCVAMAGTCMSPTERFILEVAGQLHDIGKLGVPDALLLKPDRLTGPELDVMHDHLRRGVDIIDAAFSSPELVEIVRNNLARYDGCDQDPSVPAGGDIPLGARILAIADAFSSMVSRRPYRRARTYEEAFEELRRCAGTQFDPELVEQFIDVVMARDETRARGKSEISSAVKLEIGEEAERISLALNNAEMSVLSVTASRLAATAAKQGLRHIAELASKIERAAALDKSLVGIVELATDLTEACRSLGAPDVEASETSATSGR